MRAPGSHPISGMRGPQNGWLAGSHFSEFMHAALAACMHSAFRAACMHVIGRDFQSASFLLHFAFGTVNKQRDA